jgi:catechol 2,3-dioxygenase-like lactoylglutathione lyase family enzyme
MKITRINHAAVNVHGKVDEARAFYTGVLGLPEVAIQLPGRPPIPKGKVPAFWLEQGGVQVHVIGAPLKHELREPTGPHVSWYVADLDEAVEELAAHGIEMRVLGEGRERIVWIADPAGNTVELQQDPAL